MKNNWEVKMLGDIFDVQSSKRVHKADWKAEGIPFYRAREVVKLAKNGFVDNELFISEELFKEFTKNKGAPKKDDIIISAVGTLGECYLVRENDKFYIKDASVLWFSKISDVYSKYIEFAFKSKIVQEQVMDKSMGATVGTLTISRAKNIRIPLPPPPEQKRIVKILDEAFAAIDKAKANAEKNLQNSRELFNSYLSEVFANTGKDWEERKLGEVCEVKDGTHDSPKYVNEGIPFVTQKNIREYGLSLENTKFIAEADHEKFYKRSNVSMGDILISMIGANRGMTCMVDVKDLFSIKNVGLVKLNQNIDQHYLLFFLKSPVALYYVKNASKGGAQEFIGLKALRAFPILVPPIAKQKLMVKTFEELLNETKRLKAIYQQKLDNLEELKIAILQKAFDGQL